MHKLCSSNSWAFLLLCFLSILCVAFAHPPQNIVCSRIFASEVCGIAIVHEDGQVILIDKGSGKVSPICTSNVCPLVQLLCVLPSMLISLSLSLDLSLSRPLSRPLSLSTSLDLSRPLSPDTARFNSTHSSLKLGLQPSNQQTLPTRKRAYILSCSCVVVFRTAHMHMFRDRPQTSSSRPAQYHTVSCLPTARTGCLPCTQQRRSCRCSTLGRSFQRLMSTSPSPVRYYKQIGRQAGGQTDRQARTHTHTHTLSLTPSHILTHTHTHSRTHIHTYSHTHTQLTCTCTCTCTAAWDQLCRCPIRKSARCDRSRGLSTIHSLLPPARIAWPGASPGLSS